MKLTLTDRTDTRRLRILLHGQSGAGKTWLARTVPDPRRCLLVATEPGTLSLADVPMPMAQCSTPQDVAETLDGLAGRGKHAHLAAKIDWVWLDSLSALADLILAEELAKPSKRGGDRHGLEAYGDMATRVQDLVRALCALPQHVLCTARQERAIIDGRSLLVPGLPGQTLSHKNPVAHAFDCVWALQIIRGSQEGDRPERWILTDAGADPMITAKTRDPWGRIAPLERPDVGALAARLLAPAPPQTPAPSEPAEPASGGQE